MNRVLLLAVLAIGCRAPSSTSSTTVAPAIAPRPAAAAAVAPVLDAPTSDVWVLRNARLVDGTGAAPKPDMDVLVQAGRIAEIGKDIVAPQTAREIDLAGRTLLPGFIDAHVHLTFSPHANHDASVADNVRSSDADAALRGAANALRTLKAGFTTVRNVGGSLADRSLRDAIARGDVAGPRMLVANFGIGITGGHCDDTLGLDPAVFPGRTGPAVGDADGSDEVRKAVRHQIKHGADVIKLCATAGVLSLGTGVGNAQMTLDELKAAVDEATRAGRKVAAHAHGNQGIRDAVAAGVHSIEHGSFLDGETLAMMKRAGTVLVPTLSAGRAVEGMAGSGRLSADSAAKAKAVAPQMRDSFALAAKSGVAIALGSDAGVFPHGTNGNEFVEMVRGGLTNARAIVAGTSAAADLLGLGDVGRIAVGAHADLVVVAGDPLKQIETMLAPELVMKGGVLYVTPPWAAAR